MKKKIYYFSGTHWDREWYLTYQEFRMKLVSLVDSLLDLLEADDDFGVFHFDGQTIVLEDYLEIRPENRQRLEKLIREKRILIGPWYCMPDEFLVSGESIIRNFLIGEKVCRSFGTAPWKIGYVPDIFGHIAQFPQILKGIGINAAMLARGIENDTPAFFRWKALSEDEVFTYRFPSEEGYGSFCLQATGRITAGAERTADDEAFRSAALAYLTRELNRANTPAVVAADAMDHEPSHWHTAEYIEQIKSMFPDCDVLHVDIRQMFDELEQYKNDTPVITGELGYTSQNGGMPLITHTLSSRISLKQRNSRCESLLEKQLEPALVYCHSRGISFLPAYRKLAWKYLVQNHPHDSICGCSKDTVHRDMQYRFSQTETICRAMLTEARDKLTGKRHIMGAEGGYINIFNPSPFRRHETVEVVIPFKRDFPKYKEPFGYEEINRFRLFTSNGEEVRYTIKSMDIDTVFLIYGETWNKVDAYTVVFEADINPLGFTAFQLKSVGEPVRFFGSPLFVDGKLENDFLSVSINPDGTVNLHHKPTNRTYSNLLGIWDDAEIGDGWNSVRPKSTSFVASGHLLSIEVLNNTPDHAEVCLHREISIPRELLYANRGFKRSEEHTKLSVKTILSLSRGSTSLAVNMEIDNDAMDHRLRLLIPTGCKQGCFHVNQSFAFLSRREELDLCTQTWIEPEQPEKNMKGIALERDENGFGLAFIGQHGFYECAAHKGTLYITLMRGFRRVYYDDCLTDSQEMGRHSFSFTLTPLTKDITNTDLQKMQDWTQAGLFTVPHHSSMEGSLLEIHGQVCVSALKPSDDDSGDMILRVYNPSNQSVEAHMQSSLPIRAVSRCSLLETCEEMIPLQQNHRIPVLLAPFQIVTLRIQLKIENNEG